MTLSTSDSTYFITAASLLMGSLFILRKYLQDKNHILSYFSYFLLFTGLASTVWGIGSVISQIDPLWSAVSYPIGIFLGGVGLSFFTRLSMNFILPQYRRILFWLMLIGNFLNGIYLSFNPPTITRTAAGVTIWEVPSFVALVVLTIGIGITTFNCGVFLYESHKITDRILKIRAILIALALFCYMFGGLSLNIHKEEGPIIFHNMLITLGPIILLTAIYLPQIYAVRARDKKS